MIKKKIGGVLIIAIMLVSLSACGKSAVDPGEPPVEVIQGNSDLSENNTSEDQTVSDEDYTGEIITSAVGVEIGESRERLSVDMYNNAASNTMLDYLSGSAMRFPGYTYSDEESYVAQHVRGNYTRDDEIEIADVQAGDLYLFSDGQLRLYFRDMQGVNIQATPIGYFEDRSNIEKYVTEDYEVNRDDSWGVEVYFMITKLIK
ncbi:MAG: hypothetical protein HDR29_02785 [Lachnospiraceae bacterium]|nr:hypothetical protein [Lachnospiraceae bacterium]